jgi:UDP-N-acetylglucosamine/UDP-N-acetylgalactosamine diphosphorylase
MLDRESAHQLLSHYGQQQVLRFYDALDSRGQARLLGQIDKLNLDWLQHTFAKIDRRVDPAEITPFTGVIRRADPDRRRALERGEDALREGRVGTLLVAGGQGTRLGFDGPKGAYPIGAVSGHTLFQLHAERLLSLGRRYGTVPPLYLMTSDSNHEATRELFTRHDHFGLSPDRVQIFQQGLAPAVDEQGKLLMRAPDQIVMTPNGNGGLFAAMQESGALDRMRRQGVDLISYIQVDNALSRSCDPLFVGYHLIHDSDFSCKAIPKLGPREKVGVYALVDGRLRVVEYNELPAALAEQTDDDGELLFGHSNPGLFIWSAAFIAAQAEREDLPFHRAHKKIPHLDHSGELVKPDRPCGYKFECFAMDTLPDAGRSVVLACDRDEEFAPVKNASGADSPESARALMTKLYTRWLRQAGARIAVPDARVEISPLYALDADELAARLPDELEVTGDLFLGEDR